MRRRTSSQLIAARHRLLHGRRADGLPRGGRASRSPTAGVHAIIEKPLAPDTPAADEARERLRDAGLVGAVGHIERYNPALQQARARLEAGDLGEVYQVATRRQGPFPARIADVGVVKDLGTHDIDLTAWVTQQSFVTVAARTAHKSGREHEDLVAVVGQLSNGTVDQPPRQLALAAQGAGHGHHRRAGRLRRRHPHRGPHLLRER